MYENKLKINSIANVEYNDENYSSNIQNINSKKKYIEISIPIKDGKYIPLHTGEKVNVTFFNQGNLYRFLGEVIGHRKDVIPLIIVRYPSKIYKIQRRKFVRVKKLGKVEYIKLDSNTLSDKFSQFFYNNKEKVKSAYTIDMSGGGCRISTDEKLNRGDFVLVLLNLNSENLFIKSKVIRVEQNNKYGIEFINMAENIREKLIVYLFRIMREMRKKNLKDN